MSWRILTPGRNQMATAAVTVSLGGRRCRSLTVTGVDAIAPDAWRSAARLDVELGEGEHAGKLRITPREHGPFTLSSTPRSSKRWMIRLPLPERVEAVAHARAAVNFTFDGEALVIELPEWARPRPPQPPKPVYASVTAQVMGDPPPGRRRA